MPAEKSSAIKYLVSNALDESWGLYTTTIGFQSTGINGNYPPKKHPSSYWFNPNSGRVLHEYQLIYITKGEGTFESTSVKLTHVKEGSIILLFPEEWHTYKPSKHTGWDEFWIGFNGHHSDSFFHNQFFSVRNPVLHIGYNEQIVSLYKQAIEIANLQRTSYQQALAGITTHILSLICYSDKNNSFRDKNIVSQIDKARMMMRENTSSDITPQKISRELNISYSWFRRLFKQYTGFSPAQYQMEIKLQKAKELLTSTNLQVKEISFDLNFESTSYFVTFFKAKTGLSPSEYRNKVHGKSDG